MIAGMVAGKALYWRAGAWAGRLSDRIGWDGRIVRRDTMERVLHDPRVEYDDERTKRSRVTGDVMIHVYRLKR